MLEDILADPLACGRKPGARGEYTTALSLASNRASKVRVLRSTGADDLAARNLQHLRADVETFISRRPSHPPRFASALRDIVTRED